MPEGESHFIVSTVVGTMVTICGKAILPRSTNGASVGMGKNPCAECAAAVDMAWVTMKSTA